MANDSDKHEGGSGIDYADWFAKHGEEAPGHILARLAELSDEWEKEEQERQDLDDFDASAAIYCCRRRLHQVVEEYVDEMKTWKAAHEWARKLPPVN